MNGPRKPTLGTAALHVGLVLFSFSLLAGTLGIRKLPRGR